MSPGFARVAGLVLAHGRSRRFGSEKAVAPWRGAPLIAWPVHVLQHGCGRIAVNAPAGSGAADFAALRGLGRLPDPPHLPDGPLAGVLAGLAWLGRGAGDLLVTVPCDAPRLPPDLVARLHAALQAAGGDRRAAYARTADGDHPLCAVWRPAAATVLERALAHGAHPRVRDVLHAMGAAAADFDDSAAFANVNTREALEAMEVGKAL